MNEKIEKSKLEFEPVKDEERVWIDSSEVMRLLKIEYSTFKNYRRDGCFTSSTFEGKKLYDATSIKRYLLSNMTLCTWEKKLQQQLQEFHNQSLSAK